MLKFNKKNKPSEKILCIDAFNLYNKKPGQKTQDNAGSKSFVQKMGIALFGKKHKMFSVKTVMQLQRFTPTDF